jgi:hypothetical protein
VAQVEEIMPKYVTIGYGDQAGYERTASEVLATAHANDDDLKRRGALVGVARPPVQVRKIPIPLEIVAMGMLSVYLPKRQL